MAGATCASIRLISTDSPSFNANDSSKEETKAAWMEEFMLGVYDISSTSCGIGRNLHHVDTLLVRHAHFVLACAQLFNYFFVRLLCCRLLPCFQFSVFMTSFLNGIMSKTLTMLLPFFVHSFPCIPFFLEMRRHCR